MPTTIKLKNSVTTTNAPSSLAQGEVAINITDKKVWVGNAATTPIQLLGAGGSASFTSIAFGAGTVSSPSITFTGDTNTGIYSPAADTIAFTEGGVESMRITSAGNVCIGTNTTPNQQAVIYRTSSTTSNGALLLDGNGAYAGVQFAVSGTLQGSISSDLAALYITHEDVIAFNTGGSGNVGGTERMRIDSSGNVGIGTSSPSSFNAFANQLVVGNGSSSQGITIYAVNAGSLSFADGTAGTAPFQGYITYNHVSDYMAFYANYSGSSSPRLLINSNGTTILQGGNLAANGTGITFPATQAASSDANTLDDYEEGTFQPSWSSTGASFTYDTAYRHGRYTKIGNRVYYSIYISTSGAPTGTTSNPLTITGLPFTSSTASNNAVNCAQTIGQFWNVDWPANKNAGTSTIGVNTTTLALNWEQDSAVSTSWTAANLLASCYVMVSGFYETD